MVGDTLPQLQSAYDKWAALAPQSGFKVLNKASLASMKQLPGAAGDAATQLDAAIADFTPELATMYQGGNTPGDKALELAGHNISGDWNDQTFRDALTRIGKARDTRARTLDAIGTSGMSQNSKYDQGRQGGAQGGGQSQSGATSQHIPGGKAAGLTEGATGTGSDGKKYIVKGGVWQPATQ
jgi:hypothetical protein